mmetsp:Transcript_6114/g.23124  ORF Transcript_6114/g.23124 Transcript_6114/m.23124 type:complete len:220 (-) Transcript_6114:552-1211(-)
MGKCCAEVKASGMPGLPLFETAHACAQPQGRVRAGTRTRPSQPAASLPLSSNVLRFVPRALLSLLIVLGVIHHFGILCVALAKELIDGLPIRQDRAAVILLDLVLEPELTLDGLPLVGVGAGPGDPAAVNAELGQILDARGFLLLDHPPLELERTPSLLLLFHLIRGPDPVGPVEVLVRLLLQEGGPAESPQVKVLAVRVLLAAIVFRELPLHFLVLGH